MKSALVLLGALLALFMAGCGSSEPMAFPEVAGSLAADEAAGFASSGASADVATATDPFVPTFTERLIIRDASLELVVQDTEAALLEINELVGELDGFVASSQMTKFDEGVRASLTLRVPAESFEIALAGLRGLAEEVRRQSTSGQDVTEEYTDLQAQLRHLEATEARLLTLMEEAEDTEATLAVYSELRQVQSEIERVKGRIQFLEQSSALSTINVELVPDQLAGPISVAGWRPVGTLRQALEMLIGALQFLVDVFIWVVVFVLPVAVLVFGLPILVIFLWVRRSRKRQA
jgi:predicted small lipoprotein YifL